MIDLAKLNINDIFYAINERIDICGNINVAVNLFKVINKLDDESVLAENISLNIIPEHKRLVLISLKMIILSVLKHMIIIILIFQMK